MCFRIRGSPPLVPIVDEGVADFAEIRLRCPRVRGGLKPVVAHCSRDHSIELSQRLRQVLESIAEAMLIQYRILRRAVGSGLGGMCFAAVDTRPALCLPPDVGPPSIEQISTLCSTELPVWTTSNCRFGRDVFQTIQASEQGF